MADELIYSRVYSDQWPDFAIPYRVIKRTKTRIYVDRESYHETSRAYWDEHPEHRQCFTLDRATFERDGRARCTRNGLIATFYATAAQAIQ
jgi:hypothetical protein